VGIQAVISRRSSRDSSIKDDLDFDFRIAFPFWVVWGTQAGKEIIPTGNGLTSLGQ
jgi:hypothetical protein